MSHCYPSTPGGNLHVHPSSRSPDASLVRNHNNNKRGPTSHTHTQLPTLPPSTPEKNWLWKLKEKTWKIERKKKKE